MLADLFLCRGGLVLVFFRIFAIRVDSKGCRLLVVVRSILWLGAWVLRAIGAAAIATISRNEVLLHKVVIDNLKH